MEKPRLAQLKLHAKYCKRASALIQFRWVEEHAVEVDLVQTRLTCETGWQNVIRDLYREKFCPGRIICIVLPNLSLFVCL